MTFLDSRRCFLRTVAFATAATALSRAQVSGANGRIRLAVIGNGNKGGHLLEVFGSLDDIDIVAVCDPDSTHMEAAAAKVISSGRPKPDLEKDFRKLLERDDIDAVVIATPNHWHALQTILACQAGKDVYVEKPAAYTIQEGRMMIDASEKHRRIVQVGLQTRSDAGMHEAVAWLGEGHLGKLKSVHGFHFKPREGIGMRKTPLKIPATVDYNLWLGPAQDVPIYRDKLDYDWHWDWNTGNGEMGNIGCHVADIARCFLGDPGAPRGVTTFGNRFMWDDAGLTPNVHVAAFEHHVPTTLEINNLAVQPGNARTMAFHKIGSGIVAIYEGGEFRGFGSGKVYDPAGKQIRSFKSSNPVLDHAKNFIGAVRSRKTSDLNCSITAGHLSCTMALLGGVAWRSGSPLAPDEMKKRFANHPVLGDAYQRDSAQLAAWNNDFAKTPWIASPELIYDPGREIFTGADAAVATPFLKRKKYRSPFSIPAEI